MPHQKVHQLLPVLAPGATSTPQYKEARMVIVHVEPDNQTLSLTRFNTVLMLQRQLGLRVNDALIIRGAELLTPDRHLNDGDEILVRKVTSSG